MLLSTVDGNNVELVNIVEQVENEPDSFVKRYLSHEEVTRRFPRRRQLYELRRLLQGRVLEDRVEEFGREGLANALARWRGFAYKIDLAP